MNWKTICLSWPVFFSPTWCARSIHISLISVSSFSSRKQFKLFLLERYSRTTSLFLISIAQLGLVVWMTSMSFLRLNRLLSIEDIFSFNLLNFYSVSSRVNSRLYFRSVISLVRFSSRWFVSVLFPEINCIMLFSWLLNISSCFFFVIASWCSLNISWKIFLISQW